MEADVPSVLADQRAEISATGQPRRRDRAWALFAAIASGLLMAASFPPLDWWFLAWVALVPLLVVLPRLNSGWAWLAGSVTGLAFYRIGIGWVFGVFGAYAAFWLLVLSLLIGVACVVGRSLSARRPMAILWAMPLAFVGQEILRCEGLPHARFPYLAYGYSQADALWLAQIASICGVYGLSLLLVAFNAAVAVGVQQRRARGWIPAIVVALMVLSLALVAQPPQPDGPPIQVACVQAEVDDYHVYLDLVDEAARDTPPPKFIVLPEHTVIEFINARSPFFEKLTALTRRHSTFLCVGAHVRASPQADCYYDNVAALIAPTGSLLGTQDKSVPVPFLSDGNPAREQAVFDTPHGRVGMLVCYDTDFTDVSRRLVARGAELLLVPVMNPQKWPAQQREQQTRMAAIRSIELRRCAVRAASSGSSQIVDATGRTLARRTQEEGPGVLRGEVQASATRSLFVRGGHWISTLVGWAFLGVTVGVALHPLAARIRSWTRRPRVASPCAA